MYQVVGFPTLSNCTLKKLNTRIVLDSYLQEIFTVITAWVRITAGKCEKVASDLG